MNTNPSEHNPKGLLRFSTADVTLPEGSNLRYILNVVSTSGDYGKNDYTLKNLPRRWEKVEGEYRKWWRERYGKLQPGETQTVQVLSDLAVINMVALNDEGELDYKALDACLAKAGVEISEFNAAVHIPKLGEWDETEKVVEDQLLKRGLNVTVYSEEE